MPTCHIKRFLVGLILKCMCSLWSSIHLVSFFSLLANYVYKGEGLAGYVAANALLLCVLNSVFGIMSVITSDRRMGTLQLVVVSPANKMSLFIARSLFHIINGFVTAALGLFFGLLIFKLTLSIEQLLLLMFVWVVSIFAACGLGLVLASFTLWSVSMHLWSNLLANLLLLFSGANYPRTYMPDWMYSISNLFPLTRGVEATKLIVSGGITFEHIRTLMLQEFLLGIVFYLIGILLFYYAELLARKKGSMELD